jgi:transposase
MAHTRTVFDSPTKNCFIGAIENGMDVRAAGRKYNINKTSANRLWKKYCNTGTTHTRKRFGRPPKVTSRVQCALVNESKKNRQLPLQELGKCVEPTLSTTTVQDTLAKQWIYCRKTQKVPYLTAKQKKALLLWVKKYKELSNEDWKYVIWLDKCYIYLGNQKGDI